jgi:hypothetical protein
MLYISGKNFSPNQITDLEIWLFYCRNPILWRVVESSHSGKDPSATMLNCHTLVKDTV